MLLPQDHRTSDIRSTSKSTKSYVVVSSTYGNNIVVEIFLEIGPYCSHSVSTPLLVKI